MSSITIHSIEPELNEKLNAMAASKGMSKNRLIKELLAQSAGMSTGTGQENEYHQFCGVWNREEHERFTAAQEENARGDPGDWR